MSDTEKRFLENCIETEILAHPTGINTRTLMGIVYNQVISMIPNVNMHHIAGMLSWVHRSKGHVFLVRTPGYSIIV